MVSFPALRAVGCVRHDFVREGEFPSHGQMKGFNDQVRRATALKYGTV